MLTFDTIFSADSVEFSPFDNDLFVIGTYQVLENKDGASNADNSLSTGTQRTGRIYLFSVQDTHDSELSMYLPCIYLISTGKRCIE
jgi:hypothetical protein